ncbi:MAG: long-chain fatty acid--CoA ligase [Cyclobacteriaceae bacterium]|nr:long-chain fatty acid--CoA ligase [Cyclobacteriaceae bacterium]
MTHASTIDFTRVFDLVAYQQKKFPQQESLHSFAHGKWVAWSTAEIQKRIDETSCWLLEQGYVPGDVVAIVPLMGSAEWMIVDFACQQIGMIVVPVHPTSSPEELLFILNETQAKLCITATTGLYYKTQLAAEKAASIRQCFHLEKNENGYFAGFGSKAANNTRKQLESVKSNVSENDTLVILYTSGTSGVSKGVVLSHKNVVSNIKSILPVLPANPGERALSFLPFSHIFERTTCYAYMAFGVNIYFSHSKESINADFKSVKPAFCTSVPKTLEKMYDYLLEQQASKNIVKRKLISWAMNVGQHYKSELRGGPVFRLKLLLAKVLVLNHWRNFLGGKARFVIVGAAALRPDIAQLFSATGIMVLSGYGMTEASPFISVNRPQPGMNRFGTVGLPVPGVEVIIDQPNETGEGEFLVRGPNIMQGYYKRPDLTAEVLTNGWLRTGDMGKFVDRKFLMITGRKKDIFKTTAGIYISPQQLEDHITSSPFISQCIVVGFNKPFVSAVLVPNFVLLKRWCEETGVHWTSPAFMIHNIKVQQKIQEEIDRLNTALENYKRIKKFILSDTEWTVDTGELTTSFKLIRSKLLLKHETAIEKLYQ